tara:strand:+ start:17 stop:259 length:243 start_codon:yes stop_codon:yes gene_type:complete
MFKLIDIKTHKELKVGDKVKTFRGENVQIEHLKPPQKPSSIGHVSVKFLDNGLVREFYVNVIGGQYVKELSNSGIGVIND